ncbi:hypothetical protein EGR_11047 [Echinococcus granulosus]|uniref:Uncharacterized protein n=1 Tax=Echinococcus granulosus TaxID=6210 RepID=W6UKS4_ECHGR|nr:hypothetical protein EGR_11047 [Echinococcus granulosus]EUB54094.1 hypothetical protein EGR_11047 [Echinococcus granulosus]
MVRLILPSPHLLVPPFSKGVILTTGYVHFAHSSNSASHPNSLTPSKLPEDAITIPSIRCCLLSKVQSPSRISWSTIFEIQTLYFVAEKEVFLWPLRGKTNFYDFSVQLCVHKRLTSHFCCFHCPSDLSFYNEMMSRFAWLNFAGQTMTLAVCLTTTTRVLVSSAIKFKLFYLLLNELLSGELQKEYKNGFLPNKC